MKMSRERTNTMEGFAYRLNKLICERGLNCIQIGEMIGKDRKTIYSYKNGDCSPDGVTICKLCYVLKTTPNYLLLGKE